MRSFRKDAKIAGLVLVAALVVAQFIRIDKTNPPLHSSIAADTDIQPLLKKACYDCHSNETIWPWYSNVAPVSWLIGSDVKEGRREINFSEWGKYDAATREHKLEEVGEDVREGEMPPWYYSIMHRNSSLSPEERAQIIHWAAAARSQAGAGAE